MQFLISAHFSSDAALKFDSVAQVLFRLTARIDGYCLSISLFYS